MSGRVRNLVPFFVPGQGETVNEAMSYYATPSSNDAVAGPVSMNVRKWDDAEGFFRDTVHFVRDEALSSAPTKPEPVSLPVTIPVSIPTRRLLTPADIRLARLKAHAATQVQPPDVKAAKIVTVAKQSPRKQSSPRKESKQRFGSPPVKPRPFAGSTFETASPPPSGLPLPGFVKSKLTAEIVPENMFGREQAAVELKRMLRI